MTHWRNFERRWRTELCAAMVPTGASAVPASRDAASSACDRLLDAGPPTFRAALRAAVWMLTWSPLVLRHRLAPFGRLDREEQDALLERAFTSRNIVLRQLTGVLRLTACVCSLRRPGLYSGVSASTSGIFA